VADAQRLGAVQRREIDRQPLGRAMCDQPQDLRCGILARRVRRPRQVRALAQYRRDHPRTRIARSDFHERTDPVAIGRFDHARHVNRPDQPRGD